jgi:hypothetical protein
VDIVHLEPVAGRYIALLVPRAGQSHRQQDSLTTRNTPGDAANHVEAGRLEVVFDEPDIGNREPQLLLIWLILLHNQPKLVSRVDEEPSAAPGRPDA